MAVIDLSTLARKTPEGRVDAADVTRLALAISLNRVYTGWGAKPTDGQKEHIGWNGHRLTERTEDASCLAYRVASCLACRQGIFVDSPRQPCGLRSYHHCPKEVAA